MSGWGWIRARRWAGYDLVRIALNEAFQSRPEPVGVSTLLSFPGFFTSGGSSWRTPR